MQETLLELWRGLPETRTLVDAVKKGMVEQLVYGVTGSAAAFFAAALAAELDAPALVVASDLGSASQLQEELAAWAPDREVLLFPARETPSGTLAHSRDADFLRIQALTALVQGRKPLVVAPVAALIRRLPPPAAIKEQMFDLVTGRPAGLESLLRRLVALGYQRVDMVEAMGQFSARGGILDVFPPGAAVPVRAEFFDVEVETLREFDPITQRSTAVVDRVTIPPATEFVLSDEELAAAVARIEVILGRTCEAVAERAMADMERFRQRELEGAAAYLPFFYPQQYGIQAYLQGRTPVLLVGGARVQEAAGEHYLECLNQAAGGDRHLLPGQERAFQSWDDLLTGFREKRVFYLESLLKKIPGTSPGNVVSLGTRPVPSFHGQWQLFTAELERWLGRQSRCCFFCSTADRGRRLAGLLKEPGQPQGVRVLLDGNPGGPLRVDLEGGQAVVAAGTVREGFEFPALRLIVLGDGQIFRQGKARRRRPASRAAMEIKHYTDLKAGDFVVHAHHGIGKYLGIQTLEVRGIYRDYLFIQYAGADRLYVPTDQIDLVQKYVGAEGREPRVYSLGTADWSKVRRRVRDSVRELATELLQLYSARRQAEGYAFAPDTPWQAEFEESFPYEETPDQLESALEIKANMEAPVPMDRLLCGDVGYGKTEVALRAVFKAVMDGKQVAVLVPTTILAEQHYQTFAERLNGFPVKVEVLSRFRTRGEQEATITGLHQGSVDVVIGTHRLLQNDVGFKDLGLLIIDEEHRFGVGHKEKLKQLKHNVDVLTLTATPIPRTLHMSLVSLRDISVIDTPPEDRLPVETFVVEHSDELIAEVLQREINRGGQVFYVHNRVRSIDYVCRRLSRLVPEARVAVAHGQMKEDALEQVMVDFLAGKYDVLLCTTIIESGLDIARVNTLVVENADRMGLAQLYQLRGRVGRSHRAAYAYFTYQPHKVLDRLAEKRLEAIKEFAELGSGFKVALRDLEIRGAGDLLGPEQHGFIATVGFDLYCHLLGEAIRELQGIREIPSPKPVVELTVDAYLGDDFIPDARQKIEVYKKISAITDEAGAAELAEEVHDRFGQLPEPAANLLALARIRAVAARLGILQVSETRKGIELRFAGFQRPLVEKAQGLVRRSGRRVATVVGNRPAVILRTDGRESTKIATLEKLLARLESLASGQTDSKGDA